MSGFLFDGNGTRKYLVASETRIFVSAALGEDIGVAAFCLTLALTGARISEVLALTPERIDATNGTLIFRTLKRRQLGLYRAIPVPGSLLHLLNSLIRQLDSPLWSWGRTTAWKHVKRVMRGAGIDERLCMPKSLRHGFAVEAGQQGIPLNIVQRWLGHARLETTAIYSAAIGPEERNLARRCWEPLAPLVCEHLDSIGKQT